MATDWYVRINNVERGPISSETLKNLALDGKVTPQTPLRRGATGTWVSASHVKGLFPAATDQTLPQAPPLRATPLNQLAALQQSPGQPSAHQPPPIPAAIPIPAPRRVQAEEDFPVQTSFRKKSRTGNAPPIDVYHAVLLGVGGACMAVLAISSCLTWVTIMGGGALGIEGDGKFLLVVTIALGIGLGVELLINKRAVTSVLLSQAWGTFAGFWMIAEIMRIVALRQSPEIRDNVFGEMLATQVTPGAGLYLGLFTGFCVAVAFALLCVQRLKKIPAYAVGQTLSFLAGIGIILLLGGPAKSPAAGAAKHDTARLNEGLANLEAPPLIPAINAARGAGQRASAMNRMKMISLALLNYAAAQDALPPAYTTNKEGKPLLSWRVLILPFLDHEALYKRFHLDEPWDSENNKRLIAAMPMDYQCPAGERSGEGKTNYLAVRGDKAVFPGSMAIRLADITDGPSNTIMTVEVSDENAVVWTKPDDFNYVPGNALKGLGGIWEHGFLAAFANGEVKLLPMSLDPATLEAYFTRNGGETVDTEHPDSPHIRLGRTITLDQVMVTPKKVQLRKVKSKYDSDKDTKEPVLVLTLAVENNSQGQVFAPHTSATGKDSFGNELEKIGGQFGSFFPEGSAEFDDLLPRHKAIVLVCLVPKMKTAKSYQWEISSKCNNTGEGYRSWTLTFDASEIDRESADAEPGELRDFR